MFWEMKGEREREREGLISSKQQNGESLQNSFKNVLLESITEISFQRTEGTDKLVIFSEIEQTRNDDGK